MLTASSRCPVCGEDTLHAHTRKSIARTFREQRLRALFEDIVVRQFWPEMKELCIGSYGQAITLTRKKSSYFKHIRRGCSEDAYMWEPVEMLWKAFCYVPLYITPPLPDDGVPDINEALAIKKNPFGLEQEKQT